MNSNLIRPKNETEDLLLSIIKNCESLLNKPIEKQKRLQNSSLPNQEKHFSNHRLRLDDRINKFRSF